MAPGDWVVPLVSCQGTWRTHGVFSASAFHRVPNTLPIEAAATLCIKWVGGGQTACGGPGIFPVIIIYAPWPPSLPMDVAAMLCINGIMLCCATLCIKWVMLCCATLCIKEGAG